MRLWLSRSSEVPLREQLVTQIRLGIISGDLKVKQKLPSTRELARRFRIHSNTVSAAYRELDRSGWVEVRKGSGVYVRERSTDQIWKDAHGLDGAIAKFFHAARANGHSLAGIFALGAGNFGCCRTRPGFAQLSERKGARLAERPQIRRSGSNGLGNGPRTAGRVRSEPLHNSFRFVAE